MTNKDSEKKADEIINSYYSSFNSNKAKENLFNVINFTNWTYYNSDKISTKVYDVEISASLYEQLLPSEYEERSIKEDEVVCIQYRKSVLSEEQDQFLIEKFNKNNFMLLQQKEIQIDVELKNKIKSICNSYIEPQNNNSYTNEILDKISAAGIEVVTDKEEFDRILLQEERLQKMTGKSPKWLTINDVKFLSELGYKKFDEIVQIQNAILLSNYELNDKKISVSKAIEILGREEFLGSVSRSAFHWTSGNSKNGNHVHFDSSILFSRDKEYYQNREKLEQSNKESKEHIGILNDILTKESYFTFNKDDTKHFIEQINDWEKDNSNPQKLIIVGNIPPVMKILGISDRLIEVEHSTLDKMIRDYPLYPEDKQGHKLNIDAIRSIPTELANPVMVFKSKTRSDSYVFFTERKDSKNRTILIPLAVDKRKGRIIINEITSMYGRNNEIDFVKSNFDEDKLLYIDKERADKWNKDWALKIESSNGELVTKIQFLGQRITDIETYNPSILTKERLVNFISGNDKSEYLQKMIADENIYGFVHNNKIYLNPEFMNSNAAVHEYTHLWDSYTQKTNPELWNKGLELFKYTNYWNEVISDPNYQDIKNNDNLVLSEIHSRICGNIAEEILNRIAELDGEQQKLDALDWDREVYTYVIQHLALHEFEELKLNNNKSLSFDEFQAFLSTPLKDLINEKNISIELSWKNIINDFNDIDFETAHDRAIEILTENGKEKDEFMLKQETVWQLLDSGYLDIHFDINSADIDRGWYSDTLDSLSEKYVNGIIRFDEIQNIYNIEESEYFKEQNIPTINEYKPLDYNNPDNVKSFAAFLNNNFVLSGKDIFTPEIAKFILQYDANIDDKPDQLTLINNEIYCHPLNDNMNNPQKETPDTWKIYGSDKDTVLEIIGRTLDLADESTLSKNDLIIKSQLNSIYEENKNDLNKALLNSSNSIIESYLKKVKQNLTENDKKVVEKILIASQKALSGFNVEEKAVIGQFFLNSGAVSQDKLGKIISKKVIEHEKQNNKNKKQEPSYDIER